MADSPDIPIRNPFTPMAFVPPEQAYQMAVTSHAVVGGLSVLIWDILTHLPSDYKLITQYRTNLPTIIYFVSRWCTLWYAIILSIFHTAPVNDCEALTKMICAMYNVIVSFTAFLFFLRVRAIFNRNIYVTTGFFVLWVVVVAGSLTSVLSATGVHIGNTKYCTFSDLQSARVAVANITLAVFDTCVFIAITWRLSNSELSIKKSNNPLLKTHFDLFGRYFPVFTKALLHDGQKYYMVAMLANILVVVLDFAPVPAAYKGTFLAPALALTNIMACRVFRHTKLRRKSEDTRAAEVSTMQFQENDNTPASLHIHVQKQRKGFDLTTSSVTETEFHSASDIETKVASTNTRASKRTEIFSRKGGSDSVV